MKPTVGSLFAGIGGFDLGFQREGYEVRWQVENDSYCKKVLAKHWPYVRRHHDVRDCGLHNLEPVDVITGGFPCQNISSAGNMEGLDGERSALWWQMHRIIGELRPRFAVVENVANLFHTGIERVCGSLAEIGYDAEWHIISAADVGAPHLRKRVWIVAYPDGPHSLRSQNEIPAGRHAVDIGRQDVADADSVVRPECDVGPQAGLEAPLRHDALRRRLPGGWQAEPDVGRVADGVPDRVDRLRGLGNAIVPQIAQQIAITLKPHLEEVPA